MDPAALEKFFANTRARLLAARDAHGAWRGRLSSSALATATAITALALVDQARGGDAHGELVRRGLAWLSDHQNSDGGWGDTDRSLSNISTTTLVWSALAATKADTQYPHTHRRAEAWLIAHAGSIAADQLAPTIAARYGNDRTFSVPILTMALLSGRLPQAAWRLVPALPFELAAFPQQMFRMLRMPVVSYALPALIAMGLAHHRRAPARNPLVRGIRAVVAARTLRVLRAIQPTSGGFLEATPLTSFVTMTLVAAGEVGHAAVEPALEFLLRSARADGSWPIDTDLATWLTTLTVNALPDDPAIAAAPTRAFLLAQQYRQRHCYTGAAPGAWAWTDLSGGVPDADDTAGALLALRDLGEDDPETTAAALLGLNWLMNVQNSDGGIPTFCRGWGHLEFDRSSPDLTAHALRAALAWQDQAPPKIRARLGAFVTQLVSYLQAQQQPDGHWLPRGWATNTPGPSRTRSTARRGFCGRWKRARAAMIAAPPYTAGA